VHALDRHATLAHCGGATFHRAGAHVACSKDTWPARLQRPRRTAHAFPCGRVDDRVAGFDKALFIRSTMITSNRPIEEWGKLLSDVSAAGAILDRLLHHAEIFKTSLEMSAFS